MSTEQEFTEAVQLLAAGLGMTDAEDTPYLSQIHDRLDEIKTLLQQSHEASEAIRAEAQAVLDAHAESAKDYLRQVDEPAPADFHPFASAPEGTTVRDLPDGGRLLTLSDAAMVRVSAEGGLTFIGEDGAAVPLEPARGGIVRLPDGRYRVELPGGIRLDVSHRERVAVIGNVDGTVDVVGLTRIEGIGEEVEARPVPGGARAFAAMVSGHRGIVEAAGTIHLATASGLDLVIRFPEGDQPDQAAGPDNPPTLLCEERD